MPRFSKYWDLALFENGFARFQNDDFGGALGSLQGLYAPQFAGAFQPESWILTTTTYYFSCLYEESKSALAAFDEIYPPMAEKLKPLIDAQKRRTSQFFKLVEHHRDPTSCPSRCSTGCAPTSACWACSPDAEADRQRRRPSTSEPGLEGAKLAANWSRYLDQNRVHARAGRWQTAKNRLTEAYRTIKGFGDQVEIIRFEVAKAEKEFAESGSDQNTVLKKQTLYRPQMPAENWNYWRFQGEFWRDEIGYYQYTLRNGCPKGAE